MGLTHVTVSIQQIGGANGSYESRFLVDSGATETMVPASELARLGIKPTGRRTYELADGTRRDYAFGYALITMMDESHIGRVLFGEEETEPILGVTVLESLGYVIDPISQSLKRIPAIPLK
jgi:clan AA aspartic protease